VEDTCETTGDQSRSIKSVNDRARIGPEKKHRWRVKRRGPFEKERNLLVP